MNNTKTSQSVPHIGKLGFQPGQLGYEYDCELEHCTQRMNYNGEGQLLVEAPEGKKVGLTVSRLIDAAPALRDFANLVVTQAMGDLSAEKFRDYVEREARKLLERL